jgi:hypothetical protein
VHWTMPRAKVTMWSLEGLLPLVADTTCLLRRMVGLAVVPSTTAHRDGALVAAVSTPTAAAIGVAAQMALRPDLGGGQVSNVDMHRTHQAARDVARTW